MMVPNPQNPMRNIVANLPRFEVELTEHCKKKYYKLIKKDQVLKKWTENYLQEFSTNPYMGNKLENDLRGLRSLHYLGNKYRIVYKITYEPTAKITVFEINHRNSSYSDLAKAIGQGIVILMDGCEESKGERIKFGLFGDALTDNVSTPFAELQKVMLEYQKITKQIIEWQNNSKQTFRSPVRLVERIYKQVKLIKNLSSEYVKQRRQNFSDAILIIEPPETYASTNAQLPDGIDRMVLNMVLCGDEMDRSPFPYLKERMLEGINAHVNGNYLISLFCIFSAIDGMLTWFYTQHKPGNKRPNIKKKLNIFFQKYEFGCIIAEQKIRPKFESFFKHRNEVMHGDKNSHFDKNLSTVALLFFIIVFISITEHYRVIK